MVSRVITGNFGRRGTFRSLCAALAGFSLVFGPVAGAQQRQPAPVATAPAAVDRTAWLYVGSDIPPDVGWQFGTLGNGLRFAVRRNGVPPGQVSIRLRVDAGSFMEQPHQEGWAHLIEHLSFRESRYLASGEARRAWQRLGVSFGSDSNASTGHISTVYQLDIPAATPESLAESMRLLSGMIREPVLTDATVDAERPIVVAERRERDGPEFRIATASREHMFRGQLLGQRSTIGTETSLQAANGRDISAFHQQWYRPERVVIAIAGDIDPALLERAIVENFASWRATGPAPVEPELGRPDASAPLARVIVEPSQPLTVQMAVMRPWQRVTDSVAYTQGLMLDSLATFVVNRRLEERARDGARYLAATVQGDKPNRSADITGLAVIPIGTDWQAALADARSVVAGAMETAPSQADIDREFANVETYLARELANAQNEPGTKQAEDLIQAVDIGETTTSPDHALDIWRSTRALATPDHIRQRIRAMFTGEARRIMLVTPAPIANGEAQLVAALERPARALAQNLTDGRAITIADLPRLGTVGSIQSDTMVPRFGMRRLELSNGVTALIRDIDIEPDKIRIQVRWGGGRRSLSATRPNLLWAGEAALIESGIGSFTQSQIERMSTGRQIGMRFSVDDDAFELTAETNAADFADQMRLLATKLHAPGWQSTPIARIREGRLASFDLARNSPMAVLQGELDAVLYAGDRRFATPGRAEISALTPAAFRAFWQPIMRQGPIEVQIFGDVARVDLESGLLASFGALPVREAVVASTAALNVQMAPVPPTPLIIRHTGGDSQAALVLAYPTGGGLDAIRTSRQLDVLAAIFNDRLYDRLRDQAGASYSQAVTSRWPEAYGSGGYLFVGGLVRPQDSHVMAAAARDIAARLLAAPVSDDELQRAIGPVIEQIVRASSGNVFWMLETEGATRDPRRFSALQSYLVDLRSTTAADVQRLAQTYLMPDRAIPVLILPPDVPEPALSLTNVAR